MAKRRRFAQLASCYSRRTVSYVVGGGAACARKPAQSQMREDLAERKSSHYQNVHRSRAHPASALCLAADLKDDKLDFGCAGLPIPPARCVNNTSARTVQLLGEELAKESTPLLRGKLLCDLVACQRTEALPFLSRTSRIQIPSSGQRPRDRSAICRMHPRSLRYVYSWPMPTRGFVAKRFLRSGSSVTAMLSRWD